MIELKRVTAYTVQEVAEAMKVKPATIRRYINNGTLKAQKIGAKWYITDKILEDVLIGDTLEKPVSSVVSETTDGER